MRLGNVLTKKHSLITQSDRKTLPDAVRSVETARRPLVGFAEDYPAGFESGTHKHPRAQLLFAAKGVMRIETSSSVFSVPPSTALHLPANESHNIQMEGEVKMRALFLRKKRGASYWGTGHGPRHYPSAKRTHFGGM